MAHNTRCPRSVSQAGRRSRPTLLCLAASAALLISACGSSPTSEPTASGGAASNVAGASSVGGSAAGSAGLAPVGGGGLASDSGAAGEGVAGAIGSAGASGMGAASGMSAGGRAGAGGAGATSASGAAGTSAGGAGAGGASGAGGVTSSACAGLFCEDFEAGSLDPSVWTAQSSGGQPLASIQSKLAAHGKYAVQFHAKPNITSFDYITTKKFPAALRQHHFGRAYFQVTPKPPAQHTAYLFASGDGFPKMKYLEVASLGSAWQLTFVDLIGGGETYASGGTAPQARWICLEWEFNDVPDQAAVFVDGTQSYARPTMTLNNTSTGLVGGFTTLGFGYYAWHPATYDFDVYYDDIVVDTKRVGCLNAP